MTPSCRAHRLLLPFLVILSACGGGLANVEEEKDASLSARDTGPPTGDAAIIGDAVAPPPHASRPRSDGSPDSALLLPRDATSTDAVLEAPVDAAIDATLVGFDAALFDAAFFEAGPEAPSCSARVTGAVDAEWTSSRVSAEISYGSAYLPYGNAVALHCGSTGATAGARYEVDANISLLPGRHSYGGADGASASLYYTPPDAGTYVAFGEVQPSAPCTFEVDAFSPTTRGGLYARYECPLLAGDPSGSVSITGTFVFPAIVPGAALPMFDSGSPSPPADAGLSGCMMQVSGAYDTGTRVLGEGGASEVTPDDPPDLQDTMSCDTVVDGVGYQLTIPFATSGTSLGARMRLSGATWCTEACSIDDYVEASPCTLDIAENGGVGGTLKATFDCASLYAPTSGADAGQTLHATGTIDTTIIAAFNGG